MKTKVQQFMEGTGTVRMWGFSPAVDLHELAPQGDAEQKELQALCVMPADVSSILLTMGKLRRKGGNVKTNLYVMEKHPEVHARHILLLSLVFDPDLGMRECTEIFLEIYGNHMLRKQTSAYLQSRIEELIRFLTDGEGPLAALIDTSLLKFKQRDAIEKVLKSWREETECDMEEWREKRMRSYFEDRYDYRKNLIDWDYSMNVKNWAEIVHSKLYMWWRQEGIAFEIRDSRYPQPNRTLASWTEGKQKGYSKLVRGYWGDIVQSPYMALGADCEEPRLFKKRSFQHIKTCQHVAEFNVYAMLHELRSGQQFKMPDADDEIYGRSFWGGLSHRDTSEAKLEGIAEDEEEEGTETDRLDTLKSGAGTGEMSMKPPADFKVLLLEGEDVSLLQGKRRFANLFNLAVVSNQATGCLQQQAWGEILQDKARVVCEGSEFMLNLNKDERQAFNAKIVELGKRIGCSHDASARRKFKLYNDVEYPLHFLNFDRSKADAIIAECTPAEPAGAVNEDGMLADTLATSTLDDRTTDADLQGVEGSEGVALMQTPEEEITELKGSAAVKPEEPPKPGPHGFCAITGLPAKYKDPKTGLPYANVAAFKELRAKHAAEHGEEPEEAAAKVDASAEEKEEAKGGEEVKEEGQKEQGEEKEGEEEEEVEPLFLQKDRRWGLGGLAVS